MAENSKIEWTDHTFNPWIGCQWISPVCNGCYADALISSRVQMIGKIIAAYSVPVSSTTTNGVASRFPREWRKTFADMPFSSNDFANSFARSLVANRSTFMIFSNSIVGYRNTYSAGTGKANLRAGQ